MLGPWGSCRVLSVGCFLLRTSIVLLGLWVTPCFTCELFQQDAVNPPETEIVRHTPGLVEEGPPSGRKPDETVAKVTMLNCAEKITPETDAQGTRKEPKQSTINWPLIE